ncbi:hypothetical protein [Microbispora amethystogenes]|uniref:Uncharacterized protein n=1 Tax=Microbispora amethystogenes TaxID=1427754 RepID=A0ABQ4FK88_9ACTN|nr:hypothetical protein [Microbispora amethystogenes]GIH35225.1 hypothetical protein Mam01_53890 [Microbispora amethystogenes]
MRGDGSQVPRRRRGRLTDGGATAAGEEEPDNAFWIAHVMSPATTVAAIVVPVHLMTAGRFNQLTVLVQRPADDGRESIRMLPIRRHDRRTVSHAFRRNPQPYQDYIISASSPRH